MKDVNFLKHNFFIDLRSEHEYAKGHISGAVNMPILSNLERSEVGYLYKNISEDQAKIKAMAYGSDKLKNFYTEINKIQQKLNNKSNVILYCSRGGYRSKTLHALLNSLGIHVGRIEGGYKEYRNLVLNTLNQCNEKLVDIPHLIPINGLTGSGKTHILKLLKSSGFPTIDLELAANHRGSTLGAVGATKPQCHQQFENDIFSQLIDAHIINKSRNTNYAFIEMESKMIGKLTIPKQIYNSYSKNPAIIVNVPIEYRIKNILNDYSKASNLNQELDYAINQLSRYISKEIINQIKISKSEKKYAKIAELLLINHYDPLYNRSIKNNTKLTEISGRTPEELSKIIIKFTENNIK